MATIPTLGPLMGVEAFLDGSGMDPNEDQKFLQSRNPQPIDPLNENTFDPNQYGLQTQINDQTFTPDPGMTLQDMLSQRELQNSFPSTSPLSFQYGQPQKIDTSMYGADYNYNTSTPYNIDFGPDGITNYGFNEQPQELGFIDPSTVPTEAIYDESMANALPGYNYNRFPNFNKNPTRFQNFKDGFGDIRNNFEDGFENVQDTIGSGIDKFKSGLGSIKDFAIDKGNMGRNLIGSAGAMAMGLPGMVGSGVMSLLSNLGDGADYQQYTPNFDYNGLNDSMINDFYDPATGLNRFDRARKKGNTFASSRNLAEYFKTRREKKAVEAAAEAQRQSDLRTVQQRAARGDSYSDIGRDMYTGSGQAFEKQSGGYSGKKGTSTERNYGGRKDGGMIGYRDGGLASMFTRRR